MARRLALAVAVAAGLVACGDGGRAPGDPSASGQADTVRGAELFANNCAVCHGPVGEGTSTGPPLVHVVYEPSHHGDEAFQQAVARGVVAHHWDFGPMPAIGGLDRDDVADITAHVRELQRDAGIE